MKGSQLKSQNLRGLFILSWWCGFFYPLLPSFKPGYQSWLGSSALRHTLNLVTRRDSQICCADQACFFRLSFGRTFLRLFCLWLLHQILGPSTCSRVESQNRQRMSMSLVAIVTASKRWGSGLGTRTHDGSMLMVDWCWHVGYIIDGKCDHIWHTYGSYGEWEINGNTHITGYQSCRWPSHIPAWHGTNSAAVTGRCTMLISQLSYV